MDGRHLTFTRSESNSSAYTRIFPLTSDWSWMSDCLPFPISKWRNLILIDVVFENAVTNLPQNWHNQLKRTSILSHASLKNIVWLYESMICLMCCSLLYRLIRSCCSALIRRSPFWIRSDQDGVIHV
jgi:hypothetical protein